MIILSSQKPISFWGSWLCDCILRNEIYPILRRPDSVLIFSSQKLIPFCGDLTVIVTYGKKSITFWGDLTMWLYFPVKNLSLSEGNWLCDRLYFPAKNLSHSEGTWLCDHNLSAKNLSPSEGNWLCDCTFQQKIYPILRGPDYVIIVSSQKSISFWGDLTIWSKFPAKNLSHSERNWLCDKSFQPKIYPSLRGPVYVIILFSQKSIPLWGDLTMWLFPKKWNPSHSEGTWLCGCTLGNEFEPILRGSDYVIILSSQKSIPFWGDLTKWLYFPAKNLFQFECTWPCDYTLHPKIYPILREAGYMIILSSQKSIPFWGDWLCDYTFQPKIYPILRGTDYVIILSSQKSIPLWGDLTVIVTYGMRSISFWGDLTMWFYFPVKNLSHSEGNWLCDHTFQPKIYTTLRGTDFVIILSCQESIPFWGDLTMWS